MMFKLDRRSIVLKIKLWSFVNIVHNITAPITEGQIED